MYNCNPTTSFSDWQDLIPGVRIVDDSSFQLLGAPITNEAIEPSFDHKLGELISLHEHFCHLSSHFAYIILKFCFSVPKLTYMIRTSPLWKFPLLIAKVDDFLKNSVEHILNINLNQSQWCQASLPVRFGGLGIRRVADVSLPAFIASAYGVFEFVATMVPSLGDSSEVPYMTEAITAFSSLTNTDSPPARPSLQKSWDLVNIKMLQDNLIENASGLDLARLRAASRPESGVWLNVIPSPSLGTFLDNESLRIAVALRLGCGVCQPHTCVCGAHVGEDGVHGLSCSRAAGRFSRHHALNHIIYRALVSVNVPCSLEPPGLSRVDGKRPDGLTLVPWQRGRSLVWDATCVDTFAASHLRGSVSAAGSAAETAARGKQEKYSNLSQYIFLPFAVETTGVWCKQATKFSGKLEKLLREKTGDARAGYYFAQNIGLAIQRGNAASVLGTFSVNRGIEE